MTFLEFFNAVALISNPDLRRRRVVENVDQSLNDTDIDSLDRVMISVYLCDAYGIPEEVGKHMPLTTVTEIERFLQANKVVEPESFEAALEAMK